MQDYTEHNEEVCEKYSRFVVEVLYKGEEYYTIWGADQTLPDKNIKILSDSEGYFLLFATVEDMIAYAKQGGQVFDKKNFDAWLAEIKLPIESDSVVDLDLLNKDSIDVDNVALFDNTNGAVNFVNDYCYQIGNTQWIEALSGYPLMNFFDAYMDRYHWSSVSNPEPITEQLLADVVLKQKELYQFVSSKIRIL